MILLYIRNSYILRPKLPKTPIFLAKKILYSSYILGKTWLTACNFNIYYCSIIYAIVNVDMYCNFEFSPEYDCIYQLWFVMMLPCALADIVVQRHTHMSGMTLIWTCWTFVSLFDMTQFYTVSHNITRDIVCFKG